MQSAQKLLDITEAADLCHIKVSTLRRWVRERRFPFVRLGRRILFRRLDIEQFVEQNMMPVLSEAATGGRDDDGSAVKARGSVSK
jgi:excisionase family DNA binding protein